MSLHSDSASSHSSLNDDNPYAANHTEISSTTYGPDAEADITSSSAVTSTVATTPAGEWDHTPGGSTIGSPQTVNTLNVNDMDYTQDSNSNAAAGASDTSGPRIPQTTFLQDVLGVVLPGKHQRNIKYEMLLDKLPSLVILLLFAGVNLAIVASVLIGLFILPQGPHRPNAVLTHLTTKHLTGETPIVHQLPASEGLRMDNKQFIFYLRLPMSNVTADYFSVSKSELHYEALVEGKNSESGKWEKISGISDKHVRKLECSQEEKWLYVWDKNEGKGKFKYVENSCEELVIVHEYEIKYSEYRVEVTLSNLGDLRLFLEGEAQTRFEATNSEFFKIEVIVRYVYAIITLALFVFFCVTMARTQQLKNWNTQQRWLPILLFFQIGFHNPWIAITLFFPNIFSAIVGVVFSVTFVYIFMLYLLVFFHSLFTRYSERNYLFFYGTKIVFMVIMYAFNMTIFIWSRVYNYSDPGSTSLEDWSNYRIITIISLVLYLVYIVWLFYYIFKAVRNAHKFRRRYSARFKVIGLSSIIVLIATAVIFQLLQSFRDELSGTAFLLGHTVVLVYFIICALTFVPSTQIAAPKLAVRADPVKLKKERRRRARAKAKASLRDIQRQQQRVADRNRQRYARQ